MVELFPAETSPRDLHDIPAYVVRPPQQRANRYQAPRLSRTSLGDLRDLQRRETLTWRLAENWRRHRRIAVTALEPQVSGASEAVGVMRYQAPLRQMPGASVKHRAVAGAAGFSVMVAAGALGLLAGSQLPPPASANASAFVPASTLIASQNLPSKLPLIEKQDQGVRLETGARPGNVVYVAQPGDSFATVGRKFGLKPRTVRLVNMLPLGARIRSGQKLVITPQDGAYHRARSGETVKELAERYTVNAAAIQEHNPQLKAEQLTPDEAVFIPGAMELRYRDARQLKQRGYRSNEPWAKRLSASRSLAGAFGGRIGELAWPAAGQLSSPFGIRGYSFHPGVDICNFVGTPIRAAKGGVIVSSGWMGAYGYAVDIDHGGGVVTRYGHCSRLLVSPGQSVEAGQEIAKMGSTGRSTGPHVHFEVRIQGRAVNPIAFF